MTEPTPVAPPDLRFLAIAAARYRLGWLRSSELPALAMAALDAGCWSDAFAVLCCEQHPNLFEHGPLFVEGVRDCGMPMPTEDQAAACVLRHDLAAMADGLVSPHKGLVELIELRRLAIYDHVTHDWAHEWNGLKDFVHAYYTYGHLESGMRESYHGESGPAALALHGEKVQQLAADWLRQHGRNPTPPSAFWSMNLSDSSAGDPPASPDLHFLFAAAVRNGVGTLDSSELPALAMAALDAGCQSDAFAVLCCEKHPTWWEHGALFVEGLRDCGIPVPTEDESTAYVLRYYFEEIAEGRIAPREGLGEVVQIRDKVLYSHRLYDRAEGWLGLLAFVTAYYTYDEIEGIEAYHAEAADGSGDPSAIPAHDRYVRQLAGDWLRKYGRNPSPLRDRWPEGFDRLSASEANVPLPVVPLPDRCQSPASEGKAPPPSLFQRVKAALFVVASWLRWGSPRAPRPGGTSPLKK